MKHKHYLIYTAGGAFLGVLFDTVFASGRVFNVYITPNGNEAAYLAFDSEREQNTDVVLRPFPSGRDTQTFIEGYLACALWSSRDSADESGDLHLEDNYGFEDIYVKSLARLVADAEHFRTENLENLKASGLDESQWGHDLWLTQNGHGTGFWDRGLPDALGRALTDAAKACGSVDLYVGDDGMLHI